MCAFIVLGLIFPYQAKRLAWGTSLKWLIWCWVGRKTTTQLTHVFDCGHSFVIVFDIYIYDVVSAFFW